MMFTHDNFTMSYHQARDIGIDYRDFEKVERLPEDRPLIAVAGVWGDYQDIRCLFVDSEGNGYLRSIRRRRDGYLIQELGVDAKELRVGETVFGNA